MADAEMTETEDYDKSADPTDHASNHESGGSDEISVAGLSGRQVSVPYNAKIADVSESDATKHFLDLEALLSETRKIIFAFIGCKRMSGTGQMVTFPNEGDTYNTMQTYSFNAPPTIIADGTQRLQYRQTVANDDFDIHCFGYIVEI